MAGIVAVQAMRQAMPPVGFTQVGTARLVTDGVVTDGVGMAGADAAGMAAMGGGSTDIPISAGPTPTAISMPPTTATSSGRAAAATLVLLRCAEGLLSLCAHLVAQLAARCADASAAGLVQAG